MKSHYVTISLAFGAAIALTFLLPEASESDQSMRVDLVNEMTPAVTTRAIPLEIGPRLAKVEPQVSPADDIDPIMLMDSLESELLEIDPPSLDWTGLTESDADDGAMADATPDSISSADLSPESNPDAQGVMDSVEDTGADIRAANTEIVDAAEILVTAKPQAETGEWLTYVIRPGDSLSTIFSHHDFDAGLLQRLVDADDKGGTLSRIRPGQELQFYLPSQGDSPTKLWVRQGPAKTVKFRITDKGINREVIEANIEVRVELVQAKITHSLYTAAKEAGLPDKIFMDLADIYASDIDFSRQIRPDDRFSVIFEAEYLNDERIGAGKVLAAEFVNNGESMRAIAFESHGLLDYYDEQGRSRKKAFVRTPLSFRRISSVFSDARKHPILEGTRPHRGVDYAAPTGTPVWATGNGVVKRKEYHRGYGNVIYLQHGKRYTTVYAHLSRFKKGLAVGDRIDQGEVIGYVGSTGLSTGPHLHYEFRIDDKHVDPLSLKLPAADPLSGQELARFRSASKPMLAQLNGMRELVVANREAD